MDDLITLITRHGYAIIFIIALLESLGLPVPAAVALLIGGAASAWGKLSFPAVIAGAALPIALGDSLLYFAGRSSGIFDTLSVSGIQAGLGCYRDIRDPVIPPGSIGSPRRRLTGFLIHTTVVDFLEAYRQPQSVPPLAAISNPGE